MIIRNVCVLIKSSLPKGSHSAVEHRVRAPVVFESDRAQALFRRAVYRAITAGASSVVEVQGCAARPAAKFCAKLIAQEIFRYLQNFPASAIRKIIILVPDEELKKIIEPVIVKYLTYLNNKICLGPFLTVDGLILFQAGIVLVERKNPPLGWALPGGFVDRGETVEHAVAREIKEETGLTCVGMRFFKVCSDPKRDTRFHTISLVFTGKGKGKLRAASDAKDARVFRFDALPKRIAFDHREIIQEYIRSKK